MLRALVYKVDSMQKQLGKISREKEILRKARDKQMNKKKHC